MPFVAFALQRLAWRSVQPFPWLFFYPAAFASAWLGGLRFGLAATLTSTALAWYFFVPPELVLWKLDSKYLVSAGVFVAMSSLVATSFDNVIRRRRAEEERQRLADQIAAVSRASARVSEAIAGLPGGSVHAVLHTILAQAQELTSAELVALGIGTDPNASFQPWACVGLPKERVAAIGRACRPIGTLGVVAQHDEVLRVRDVREHPAYRGVPKNHPEIVSLLGVPIRFRGKCVGNLYLGNKAGGGEFDEQDQQIVELLAPRVGVAIEIARLYEREGAERAWLQAVIDQMPDGIVLMDAAGKVVARNRVARALGADTGELDPFGNPLALDLRLPSGERVPTSELPRVRAARGEAVAGEELRVRKADGTLVPVLVSAAALSDARGAPIGAVTTVQDISALKEHERLREEWASLVAHDLKQPVNVIRLSVDTLARVRGAVDERERKFLERIRDGTITLGRMIDDLLDASRLEANRLSLDPERVDLSALAHESVDRVPDLAARTEIREGPRADRAVLADPRRVAQVLGNLLSNALKYGDHDAPIELELLGRDDEVEVVVRNRGLGIPADELPSLFHRFQRSRTARATRIPGVGLGLYVSKGLIEAQGGRIWVESTEGGTTSFHFTLPLAKEPDARADVAVSPAAHDGGAHEDAARAE